MCQLVELGVLMCRHWSSSKNGEESTMSNVCLKCQPKRASKIDCDLMKYLILSLLMKTDVIRDERFMPLAEGWGGGHIAPFLLSSTPIKDWLFDQPAYYSSLAM